MPKGRTVALIVVVVSALGVFSCGGDDGESGTRQVAESELPEVTTAEAEQAMSDAMLVSALSLFLVFGAEDGNTNVANDEGSVSVSWDDKADFTTGVGLYTITMTDYTVPTDDPFGADYNGYVLNGTVVMGSPDGISTTLKIDLATIHPDAETFPVQTIELDLEGIQESTEQMPEGEIRINGHEMSFEDLAPAFD